jgi:ferredoxin
LEAGKILLHRLPIRSVCSHGIIGISDRHYFCKNRNFFSSQTIRVTFAVNLFVMIFHSRNDLPELPDMLERREECLELFAGAQQPENQTPAGPHDLTRDLDETNQEPLEFHPQNLTAGDRCLGEGCLACRDACSAKAIRIYPSVSDKPFVCDLCDTKNTSARERSASMSVLTALFTIKAPSSAGAIQYTTFYGSMPMKKPS